MRILIENSLKFSRGGDNIVLKHSDLDKGAKLQLRGHLQMSEFERRIVPTRGLSDMVLSNELHNSLKEIVRY